ncbi:MAG: stage II sporulation protein M [Candidatus Diapherotrites archaeon]
MVLESILGEKDARKHPLVMMLFSIALSSVGLWVSYFTFPSTASTLGIAFVTIAAMPVLYSIFVAEEEEEAERPGATLTFIERHFDILKIFGWFFIGLIISYSFWYFFLPQDTRSIVFSEQEGALGEISDIRNDLTETGEYRGSVVGSDVKCTNDYWCIFKVVLANNSTVLFLSILISFAYGAGALFLIGWNASVIGVLIGKDAMQSITLSPTQGPLEAVTSYGGSLVNGLSLIPHGLPEIGGYLIGAIAGGIISVAITKKKYRTHEFQIITKDSLLLTFFAFMLLIVGALIEAALIVGG